MKLRRLLRSLLFSYVVWKIPRLGALAAAALQDYPCEGRVLDAACSLAHGLFGTVVRWVYRRISCSIRRRYRIPVCPVNWTHRLPAGYLRKSLRVATLKPAGRCDSPFVRGSSYAPKRCTVLDSPHLPKASTSGSKLHLRQDVRERTRAGSLNHWRAVAQTLTHRVLQQTVWIGKHLATQTRHTGRHIVDEVFREEGKNKLVTTTHSCQQPATRMHVELNTHL